MHLNKEIKNSALLIAIITASLYLHGLAFHQGFLRYWGIEDSMFPLSFEKTLVGGYVAYMHIGSKALGPLLLLFISIFVFTIIFNFVLKLFKQSKLLEVFHRKKKNDRPKTTSQNEFPESIYGLILFSGWGVIISYVGIVSLLILIILGNYSDRQGYNMAEKIHAKFDSGKISGKFNDEVKITYSLINKTPDIGKIIIWGNGHCAIYTNNQVAIISNKDIEKITSNNTAP